MSFSWVNYEDLTNFLDVPQPVHTARIASCNEEEPIVVIDFEHYEPAERSKPVEEFWLFFIFLTLNEVIFAGFATV